MYTLQFTILLFCYILSFVYSRTIETVNANDPNIRKQLQTDTEGQGCIYLPAGMYTASIKLSSAADEAGMR